MRDPPLEMVCVNASEQKVWGRKWTLPCSENRAKECGPIDFVTPYYGEIRKGGETSYQLLS